MITCRGDIINKGLEKVIIHLKKSCQKDIFFIDRIIIEYIQNLTCPHNLFSFYYIHFNKDDFHVCDRFHICNGLPTFDHF